ncbi:sensor histidine kinase [Arsenicicoccus sp. oral taxon 190]|uniref:sensor histidine kinase n=1 Tax=Arsenicicoccus sp. oral taxon 190 TaxID=1658671 RepID=UPI00067A21DB|nr:HAMP domain-containing sensor histidine kinase [Arsenicicoccus sp. oral taxon 190]AKT50542.1 histidine kinase [Arsenicicoccus sp. oral taxon 190]
MRPQDWSLTTKLVTSVVALFLAVTVAIGGATVLVMEQRLTQQVDAQLADQRQMIGRDPRDDGGGVVRQCTNRPPGTGEGMLRACLQDGDLLTGYVISRGSYAQLTGQQTAAVESSGASERPKTVSLGDGLGDYRLVASYRAGTTIVTGVPLTGVRHAVGELLRTITLASLTGLLLVGLLGTWLVRRNLRPLRRVADTATEVSRMELASGEVALVERVPADLANQRTEVGQVGHALNTLLDNVGDALTARHQSETRVRQFVADASHELRTPLSSIRGYAELSRREREPVPAGVRHALDRIESEALRMGTLVEDLLLLARLDAGRPLEHEPVDLSMLVLECVSDAQVAARDHRWEMDLPEVAIETTGDRDRLHQVVVNLLANAHKYTPAGTVVRTSLAVDGSHAVLQVHDDGPGIAPELQPNLFQRFTRGDTARNRAAGSTGLGLSIVDAVVKAHHGDVSVASVPGSTTFTVRLPLRGGRVDPATDHARGWA